MTLTILSLEDEADVRAAIERDLDQFWDTIRLEAADNVEDAWAVVEEIDEDGDELALVLSDHRLPGESGVDFLVALMADSRFASARTVLVTGQADQDDTIRAVNEAGLDYYIAKPWDPSKLREVVRDQLTEYVLASEVDPLPYLPVRCEGHGGDPLGAGGGADRDAPRPQGRRQDPVAIDEGPAETPAVPTTFSSTRAPRRSRRIRGRTRTRGCGAGGFGG